MNERLAVVFNDPEPSKRFPGVAEVCDAKGAGIALVSGYPEDETPAWSIKTALVDGFIVFALEDDNPLIREARQRKLPFVAVDFDAGPDVPSVRVDDRGGARQAAEHLVALGHRRFAILSLELSGDGHFGAVDSSVGGRRVYAVTRDRLSGYGDALATVGVNSDHVPIIEVLNEREASAKATAELLAAHPETTAILAMTDLMALGVLDHARKKHRGARAALRRRLRRYRRVGDIQSAADDGRSADPRKGPARCGDDVRKGRATCRGATGEAHRARINSKSERLAR